ELLPAEDLARGVVRGVEQDDPGPVREGSGQVRRVEAETGEVQRDGPLDPAGEGDAGGVGVEGWLEGDDLVAGLDETEQRGGDRLAGPGRHEHLVDGIECDAVVALLVLSD